MVIYRLYDSRLPIEPRYPATKPSVADVDVWNDENASRKEEKRESAEDFSNSDKENTIHNDNTEDEQLRHAPPGSVTLLPSTATKYAWIRGCLT